MAVAAKDEASSCASAFRSSKDRKRPALRPDPASDTDTDTDTASAMLDVRVHGHVDLMTRLLSSSDPSEFFSLL